jgi:hypothetical protein
MTQQFHNTAYEQNQCYFSKEIGSGMQTVTQNLGGGWGGYFSFRNCMKYDSLFERRAEV